VTGPARVLTLALAMGLAAPALAVPAQERAEPLPRDLEGVGIDERLDAQVPLDLPFVDERGQRVLLRDYFRPDRPVIVTLNYFECPMLCTLVLNGLVEAARELDFVPGREYDIVTVSIDPRETPTLAAAKKRSYVGDLGNPSAAAGWHFLTGPPESIRGLADAVGFRFRYLEDQDEFAHGAAIYVVTPAGRVSRILYGVQFDAKTLRLSLVEAAGGRIGTPLDRVILYCYHYDSSTGTYAPAAVKIMRLGGALTAAILLAFLATWWMREFRARRTA
jgi:protein SCO1/2